MVFVGIIIAILMFSIVIIIHELGHFLTARKFKVKVLEFGIGIPPKAKNIMKDKMGTVYSINWLPLGGFVRLHGDTDTNKEKKDKTKFYNKTYTQKSIILLAGVFMNFLLSILIFSILFFIGIKPIGINTIIDTELKSKIVPTYSQAINAKILIKKDGLIVSPIKGSIAEKGGIQNGDIIIELNQERIYNPKELIKKINANKSKKIILNVKSKDGFSRLIELELDKTGKIGAYIGENIQLNQDFIYKYGLIESIKYGLQETYIQSILTIKGIGIIGKKIFKPENNLEREEALQQLTGPIGIVDFVSNNMGSGIIFLAIIMGIISINLGIFNLLPIPALDGGRFFLLTINTTIDKISRGRININKFENLIHLIFFVILIALSVLIGYNDIGNIIKK